MKLLGTDPCDAPTMQGFLVECSRYAKAERWPEAIACLESAAVAAPASYVPQLLEVLAMYYIQQNEGRKIAILLRSAPAMSPTLAVGALVVERWRRFGRPLPELPEGFYPEALKMLRQTFDAGKYGLEMIHIIQALTVQLGDAPLGVELAFELMKQEPQYVTEEMVTSTLALALEMNLRQSACDIVWRLERSKSKIPPAVVKRYKVLLGLMPLDAADGSDKVVAYLRRTGCADGKAGVSC